MTPDSTTTLATPPPELRAPSTSLIGVVAIGRNEGTRLHQCLASVAGRAAAVVYVDSGSTDSSVADARRMGMEVVVLDLTQPFTAARARNEGFARLMAVAPHIEFVQFVDGDCEVVAGWLELAQRTLAEHPRIAIVAGRRRERFPEASVYNALCDVEWDTPVGETTWCGGDAMIRASALAAVGGYDASIIAGEEPELCFRLRQKDWTIFRLDAEMTLHDAAITRFGQWWKRCVRAGHAFAEGAAMHGDTPERYCVREVRRGWIWGFIVPLLALLPAWPTRGLSLLLLLGYPLMALRVYRAAALRGLAPRLSRRLAFFTMLAKFPQACGQLKFTLARLRGRKTRIIEYKN
jgi:GT2 family glycosyltransferase